MVWVPTSTTVKIQVPAIFARLKTKKTKKNEQKHWMFYTNSAEPKLDKQSNDSSGFIENRNVPSQENTFEFRCQAHKQGSLLRCSGSALCNIKRVTKKQA